MASRRRKYDERVRRWRARVPEKTRLLNERLAEALTPILIAAGFENVEFSLQRKDSPVEGRELRFERVSRDWVDVVYVFFDKYDSPRFQVAFSRRAAADPDTIIRSGYIVDRPSEYYHEWGKPRWIPMALWPAAMVSTVVAKVVSSIDQVLHFLETGERGDNINRSSNARLRSVGGRPDSHLGD